MDPQCLMLWYLPYLSIIPGDDFFSKFKILKKDIWRAIIFKSFLIAITMFLFALLFTYSSAKNAAFRTFVNLLSG
jgi:hypothetical protein